jgi:hypothetical protein
LSLEEIVGYLNQDLASRTSGEQPLRYVDVDDPELGEYPAMAEAVRGGGRVPLVQVGDKLKHPSGISIYWAEEELRSLGVDTLAGVKEGN